MYAAAADDHIKIKSRLRRDRVGESDLAGLDILHSERTVITFVSEAG